MSKEFSVLTRIKYLINLIKTSTDKIGTVSNTGGTASIGAVLGNAANSSIVTRLSAIKAQTDLLSNVTGKTITSIPSGCFLKSVVSIQGGTNPMNQNVTPGLFEILSGAVTANTYKEVLAVTGSGVIYCIANIAKDATSRTVSMKLVLDGVEVCDESIASVAAAWGGLTPTPWGLGHITFHTSLSVQIKSSISETDKVATMIRYALT